MSGNRWLITDIGAFWEGGVYTVCMGGGRGGPTQKKTMSILGICMRTLYFLT